MHYDFSLPSVSARFIPVWRRNFLVWKKLAGASILGNIADPMIALVAFGYGLGSLLPQVEGVPYIQFLAAGTVCMSTMNAATFEALYSAFSRMHVQRTWDGIMNAPVDLEDVLLGELTRHFPDETEIGQLGFALDQQDVLRLDVAMLELVIVQVIERGSQIAHMTDQFTDRQPPGRIALRQFGQAFLHRAAVG